MTQGLLPVPTLGRYAEARRFLSAAAANVRPRRATRAWGHLLADRPGTIHMVGDLAKDFVAYAQAAAADIELLT